MPTDQRSEGFAAALERHHVERRARHLGQTLGHDAVDADGPYRAPADGTGSLLGIGQQIAQGLPGRISGHANAGRQVEQADQVSEVLERIEVDLLHQRRADHRVVHHGHGVAVRLG